jgi:hypothetical protein
MQATGAMSEGHGKGQQGQTVKGSLPVSFVHIITMRATQKNKMSWPALSNSPRERQTGLKQLTGVEPLEVRGVIGPAKNRNGEDARREPTQLAMITLIRGSGKQG